LTNPPGAKPDGPAGVILGSSQVKVWGMTPGRRLARTFERLGLTAGPVETAGARGSSAVMTHAGWVYDEALIKALCERQGVALVDGAGRTVAAHVPLAEADSAAAALEAGETPAGVQPLSAMELLGAYNSALRKREPPVLERLTPETVRAVEKRLFQGSYKGVTDLVTKYVWPTPARIVTRWCALAGITPNQVTFTSLLLVIAAFWLFWTGHFLWGLGAAWIMTFLDTVDGKLARVTLNSSPLGNIFDHGIDLVHPPFWWAAWLVGVQHGLHPLERPDLVFAAVIGGYVVQRALEGIFLHSFKLHVHAWRPFDSFFRLITARRNPNLILLTPAALLGRPDIGLVLVGIWTVISLGVHLVQLVQAFAAPRTSVVSWLSR
jgi:phosphatidylglycerophosphate synthase